ncbi:hypothetical protein QW060_02000 [Myroides ceti]|uniref:Uncharacterized protein n=1 Tax=Paenimyroides ceti TaxID=395087 RepID=A0ABT8CQL6_9FLAO|nr:hypothetical protein [Paenimyroides ceti]MDN3705897.1 hypothetical protein [Paenimyroides ceti]
MRKLTHVPNKDVASRLKPISRKELIKTLVEIENTSELYILAQDELLAAPIEKADAPFFVRDLTTKDKMDDFISHLESVENINFTFLNKKEFESLTKPPM